VIDIRDEHPGDSAAIRDLNRRAFGQDQEGTIVDVLRTNGAVFSLWLPRSTIHDQDARPGPDAGRGRTGKISE
jgi:hypothetical protein